MSNQDSSSAVLASAIKIVAILFSGGDAPGMNSLLQTFVRLGINRHQLRVLGVKDGFAGLVWTSHQLAAAALTEKQLKKQILQNVGRQGLQAADQYVVGMNLESESQIMQAGGIVLGTSRCQEFREEEVRGDVLKLLNFLEVDALVVVGGDGSMRAASVFANDSGLPVIGIPATIDDDYPLTEWSLGAESAVSKVVQLARSLNIVASSTRRIMVLETMGRDSGLLALRAAISAGAEIVVTPEAGPLTKGKMCDIADQLATAMERGRRHAVVLVAEGVKLQDNRQGRASEELTNFLTDYFDSISIGGTCQHIDIRLTVPGYIQRGEAPTLGDIELATDYAEAAWVALTQQKPQSGVLGLVDGRIKLQDFDAAPSFDREARLARLNALFNDMTKYVPSPPPEQLPEKRKRKAKSPPQN